LIRLFIEKEYIEDGKKSLLYEALAKEWARISFAEASEIKLDLNDQSAFSLNNLFLIQAIPDPVLKYFSKEIAFSLVSTPTKPDSLNGL
jgi:hypothetical protein